MVRKGGGGFEESRETCSRLWRVEEMGSPGMI